MNPFLPEDNRASVVRKKALTFYILVIAGFYIFLNFFKTAAPGVLGFASNIFVDDIVADTNAYRRQNGLSDLRFDSTLSQAAQKKAEDMFEDDYWAHIAPDGTTPWTFITRAGYDYVYAGENLAKDFQKSGAVVVAWMESPSHRQNILNEKFKDIGVAVVNGELDGYETTLVVQMFGQRPPEALAEGGQRTVAPEVLSQPESTERAAQSAAATEEGEAGQRPAATVGSPVEIPSESVSIETPPSTATQSRPKIDVFSLTRGLSMALGTMVLGFFTVDTYEARRRGITRLSGHTVAHFAILLLLLGVTVVMRPGTVL
jgi:hypothetical protein